MKKNAFIFVALCLLSACGGKGTNDGGKPQVIDLETAISTPVSQMLLSDIAEDIEIVPLETKEETVFHCNLHIISCKDGILLCPGCDSDSRLMLFDRQGKFVRYIGSIGQGPEEYRLHPSIGYDEEKQEVWVPDETYMKVYGIDGKFKRRSFKYRDDEEPYWYANGATRENRFYRLVDGYHIFRRMFPVPTMKEPWQIMVYNDAEELIAKIADPITKQHEERVAVDILTAMPTTYWESLAPVISFYHGSRNILIYANDTIYHLPATKDKLEFRYLLKTGSENFKPEVLHSVDMVGDFLNKFIQTFDILESQDYMFIVAEKGLYSYLCRFDKNTGEVQSIRNKGEVVYLKTMRFHRRDVDVPGFTDDLAGGVSFFPEHTNDNEWIGVIPAERLLTEIDIEELEKKEVKLPHRKQQLINVLKNLKEDDNPVLMIVKLK